tara:strand:+ start:382 stop:804 length:423 start_codon:yes stop_codon:yes gene_type:complete
MFFKNNKNEQSEQSEQNLSKVAALLIHAAKIDQDYSIEEENIVKKTMLEIGANNENIINIMKNGKEIENDSNQILDFTKEVKNMKNENKIKIVESLWRIIYSNKEADIYETNLMRRLAGLLYIDSKIMGNIKERIKKENH